MEKTSESEGRGARAEERNLSDTGSYLQNFESYFQGISSYLPSSIKKTFPSRVTPASSMEEKDSIISASFDRLEITNGQSHQCLILTFVNGFQIWDLQNPENVHELCSRREGPIKTLKFLPPPLIEETENCIFFEKRPLFAVLSDGDANSSFPNTQIKIYSLRTNSYINEMRFKNEVLSVLCSKNTLVIGLKEHIYGFDSSTMKKVFSLQSYPNTSPPAVIALGPRWLAYASNQPVPGNRNQTASDKIVEAAKGIASNLYSFGMKTFSDYMYPKITQENPPKPQSESKDKEVAGSVIVYDIFSQRNIAHFYAHNQPLSALFFDPSGTLLVTSSVEGHNFNVFQIRPSPFGGLSNNYRHLYKLQRGLTNATIQNISWSDDSRWMAVNSIRGTTHIYAISPNGGPISIHTHLRSPGHRRKQEAFLLNQNNQKCITLTACYRIKQAGFDDTIKNTFSTSAFAGNPHATDQIYVVSHTGILIQYKLKPHRPRPDSDLDPDTLQLDVEPVIEWDICRRTKWPELQTPIIPNKLMNDVKNDEKSVEPRWLSNVEICTHSPYLRPLWATPQFTFKTFEPENVNNKEEPKYFFYENKPTKKIEVRYNDPMPFKESFEQLNLTDSNNHEPQQLYDNYNYAPSVSPSSEKKLKENLFKAMSTPIENPENFSIDPSELSIEKTKEEIEDEDSNYEDDGMD